MPCRDYSEEDVQRGRAFSAEQRADILKEQCNKLTEMLCHVVGYTSNGDIARALSPEVLQWYAEHRAADLKNLQEMFLDTDLAALSKEDFDKLDTILNKYK